MVSEDILIVMIDLKVKDWWHVMNLLAKKIITT